MFGGADNTTTIIAVIAYVICALINGFHPRPDRILVRLRHSPDARMDEDNRRYVLG